MEFKITVSKRIAQTTSTESLICGNDGDTLTVTFDDEWTNISAKTARLVWIKDGEYTYIDVPFTGTSCPLPAVIQAKMLFVGFFAGDSTENTLKTSTPAQIPCISSILDIPAEAFTPDVYRNILDIIANKVDKVEGKELSTNDYTDDDKDKLETLLYAVGINSQAIAHVNESKVDKVEGKRLSTNDYTDEDKAEVAKIAEKADISNPLSLSDTDKTKDIVLIQHNYNSETSTETYTVRLIDLNNLSESGLNAYNIPTSKAVINWVKAYIESKTAHINNAIAEAVSAEQSRADNTFSNALKGSKSGGAFLIDDVSPVTHEMGVKISSDTVEDLTTVKVRKQGKNLIPFPYQGLKFGTSTYNGIDFTVYEDGSILINGTATGNTIRYLYSNATDLLGLKSGITISGSKNASDDTQQGNVYFVCNYYNSTGTMEQGLIASTASSNKKTITDAWKGLGIYINVPNGKTVNNLLIKPQLEIGATATEYEPYITPTEYIPTADGTVNGVTSLYPNTTLTTDMDGVIIDCEYNRDINKAFAALEAAMATTNFLKNTEAGS